MRKINIRQYAGLTLAVVVLLAASGCDDDPVVVIKYRQVANFYEYKQDNVATTSDTAGQGIYMMYAITAIENKGKNAADFKFKVRNVYAKDIDGEHDYGTEPNAHLNHKATDKTVKAGKTLANPGCLILRVASNDPQTLRLAMLYLNYNTPSGSQGVLMIRESGNDTVPYAEPMTESKINQLCP